MHDVSEYFHSIINFIEEAVFWKDKNGTYLGCNKYASALFGLKDPEEIVGKTNYDLLSNVEAALLQEHDKIVLETGSRMVFEEKITITPGNTLTHICSKSPLYDKSGNIIGIIGHFSDITDNKKAEQLKLEKLQKEKEAAEKMSHTLKLIVGNIAHEVRTPLSIISINIDRLLMELKKLLVDYHKTTQKNKIKTLATTIKYAVQNSSSVITMLLTRLYSIFDVNRTGIELKPASIKQSIDQAINEYPFYHNEKKLVTWDNQKNQDFTYLGDELLTKHILFNLIKNSLRAIREDEHGEISINLTSDNQFNYLIFKDTTSGIPAENLDSLFQQFDIKNKRGTGLGLAFCKTIMRAYGGDITCDSKQDEYTKFTLRFPKIISSDQA